MTAFAISFSPCFHYHLICKITLLLKKFLNERKEKFYLYQLPPWLVYFKLLDKFLVDFAKARFRANSVLLFCYENGSKNVTFVSPLTLVCDWWADSMWLYWHNFPLKWTIEKFLKIKIFGVWRRRFHVFVYSKSP